jgi:plastocyanin
MAHRREFLRAAVAGGVVVLAGCAGGGDDGTGGGTASVEETTSIGMTAGQFDPRNVRVAAGATVTWTNGSGVDHTVTAASSNWDHDAVIAPEEATTYTFETSGVYDVYCRFHGSADLTGMSMKIAVGEATIEAPLGGSGADESGSGGY